MGFLAFSGGPMTPPESTTAFVSQESADVSTLALKDDVEFVRASGEDTNPFLVKLTSYNAVPEQTDGNPHVTASGAHSNPEVVAARSIDLKSTLPFGTVIEVTRVAEDTENCHLSKVEDQIGYRVIADSMHSRKRNQIDILLDATNTVEVLGKQVNPSLALGMCSGVSVKVVGKIDIKEIPSTQEELRRIVEGDNVARR